MSLGEIMFENMGWGVMEEEGEGWRKGPWTSEEDRLLIEYVNVHGEGRWNSVASPTGLKRNGKSCRLRWVNYLRPDLKRGQITPHEETIILELHARWGNRWSTIARSLPGRTDNEIKNYWRTHFKKKGKIPLDDSEKLKTRLLKRQQFQQQQHQQNQMDMKKIVPLLDQIDNRVSCLPQMKQDTVQQDAVRDQEQQCLFCHMLNGYYSTLPESSNDDSLWDGLWNLEDVVSGYFCSKASLQQRCS